MTNPALDGRVLFWGTAVLSPAEQRAETAHQLREEAAALLAGTGLFELLGQYFSTPRITGSAIYDLMVWRDLDLQVAVEGERWAEWMAFGTTLAQAFHEAGMPVYAANYMNDWIDQGQGGQGLYWGFGLRDLNGNPWQVDIWGWDPFDYAVYEARDFTLATDLRACDRDLILRLKTEARARPDYYGPKVTAFDIYHFVIAGGGDSLGALEAWKKQQG